MAYIIDGHNLIPKIRGLRLDLPDDEEALIKILQDFCRLQRKNVEVYFDRAAAGYAGKRGYGRVTAHFVREGSTADTAIISRLRRLKKGARNATVVSSDHQIISEAKAMGAKLLRSEEFAQLLFESLDSGPEDTGGGPLLSSKEVDEWMDIFRNGNKSE